MNTTAIICFAIMAIAMITEFCVYVYCYVKNEEMIDNMHKNIKEIGRLRQEIWNEHGIKTEWVDEWVKSNF